MDQMSLERQAVLGAINGEIRQFSSAFEQMVDQRIADRMTSVRNDTFRGMGFKMKCDSSSVPDNQSVPQSEE